MSKLENFEQAFDPGAGSCVSICVCGREFYNPSNDWDWCEGELERLEIDPNVTALDYPVPYIKFEEHMYVSDCDCWKKRAEQIIQFLDGHRYQIAKYLSLEKKRKTLEAELSPIVEV